MKQTGGPAKAVAAILQEAGFPQIPALSSVTWRGTLPLTRQTSPPASSRIFLLGDAAAYVEPFTGEGIAWALASAIAVVPLVLEAADQWNPRLVHDWTAIHRRRIKRRQTTCRVATAALRHPMLVSGLMSFLMLSPHLGGRIIRLVGGAGFHGGKVHTARREPGLR
jgi:2-polyprenyl-6-methoxyphenol hydroxylase-like FAD-dependent oxidoreductase